MFHWKYNGHFGDNSFQAIDCTLVLETRDGPKFGRREKNVRLGSARQHVTIRPNLSKHSASFVASHLQRFALAAGVNYSQYTHY